MRHLGHLPESRRLKIPQNLSDLSKSGIFELLREESVKNHDTVKLANKILTSLSAYEDDDDPVKLLTGINPMIHQHSNRRIIIRKITDFLPERQRIIWQRIHDSRELEVNSRIQYLTLTRPIDLPPHAPVAQKIAD